MSITLNLGSALEAQLQAAAAQQGKQVETMALELLAQALPCATESSALRVRQKIQELGDFRSFAEFKAAQVRKYGLP